MPPPKVGRKGLQKKNEMNNASYLQQSLKLLQAAIFDPNHALIAMAVLFTAEIFLNVVIVQVINYTEIDWVAYMQEVEGVINGTYDYTQLKGDTGPLVYPAGFVYVFMALYYVTSLGTNLRLAQYIYILFYLITILLVFNIYRKVCKLPPWALVFVCCTSYRIHSIYVLRLFNDPVAMILVYAAINLFLYDQWLAGCIFYSLAVSVKMNILLFAPGLLILLLHRHTLTNTIILLSVCALIQLVLGAPFLADNPVGYMLGAFNLGRQFLFEWTVNWRFLPEEVFSSRYFHLLLLAAHLLTLAAFYVSSWCKLFDIRQLFSKQGKTTLSANDIVRTLFISNFIGMCFSRSLHYQFYVWYFHTLHYLVWNVDMPSVYRVLILGTIEMCWNTYPSTVISSGALHACHAVILLGLFISGQKQASVSTDKQE